MKAVLILIEIDQESYNDMKLAEKYTEDPSWSLSLYSDEERVKGKPVSVWAVNYHGISEKTDYAHK